MYVCSGVSETYQVLMCNVSSAWHRGGDVGLEHWSDDNEVLCSGNKGVITGKNAAVRLPVKVLLLNSGVKFICNRGVLVKKLGDDGGVLVLKLAAWPQRLDMCLWIVCFLG
jgi:hypothetical protein